MVLNHYHLVRLYDGVEDEIKTIIINSIYLSIHSYYLILINVLIGMLLMLIVVCFLIIAAIVKNWPI